MIFVTCLGSNLSKGMLSLKFLLFNINILIKEAIYFQH